MKRFSHHAVGNASGHYEKMLMVLLATALHALAIYLLVSSPVTTPSALQAEPAVTLELGLTYATEETANTPETAVAETTPPPVETDARQDPPSQIDPLSTAQFKPVTPQKSVEKPSVPKPSAKPVHAPAQKPTTSPPQANAPTATGSAAQAPSNQAATSASPVATGVITPATANAGHLNNPAPTYPALALKRKWQGTVRLRVLVLANGKPGDIQILSSSKYDMLDQAAITAVRQWTFVPAKRDGISQDSWTSFPLSFKLQ